MLKKMFMFMIAMVLAAGAAYAAPADLPKTGETTCYDAAGGVIVCTNTGQDGDLQKGVTWPSTRWTVDGTGLCVTDNLTGLMWVKTPDATTRTWATALTYANGLSLCGYDDWRLPNVNELESLINAEQANTARWLNTQGFSNVQARYYWSSTTYANRVRPTGGASICTMALFSATVRLTPTMYGLFVLDSRLFGDLEICP